MGGHRPAPDDQPGVGVLDRGELQPALAGAQIGDVGRRQHVRPDRLKSRSTRSVAGVIPGIRIVVLKRLRGLTPEVPAAFISLATRFYSDPDVVLEPQLGVNPR